MAVLFCRLLDLPVSNGGERGLLGIAIKKQEQHTFVYLSFIASSSNGDINDNARGTIPKGNFVYRYELIGNKLISPKTLFNISAAGPFHYGGPILVDNGFLYHIVGDLGSGEGESHPTNAINIHAAPSPDGRAGILRIPIDNTSKPNGIIGALGILRLYYAYGIRNGFGMDKDPVSGNIWDTENGPDNNDEINLVGPGFNSGWRIVQGLSSEARKFDIALSADPARLRNFFDPALSADELSLVDFGGKGKYKDPELVWHKTVGVTAIKFYPYDILGPQYKDDLFVGDFVNGNLYHFDLSKNRTSLVLHGLLHDKVADTPSELQDIIFGTGFNGITDIKTGPDGYLYIVSLFDGTIYRIVPKNK